MRGSLERRQTAHVVRVRRLRGREHAIAKAVSMISMRLAEGPTPQRLLVLGIVPAKDAEA
jgi:hypothetical protein